MCIDKWRDSNINDEMMKYWRNQSMKMINKVLMEIMMAILLTMANIN